jgi:hypothetical protein
MNEKKINHPISFYLLSFLSLLLFAYCSYILYSNFQQFCSNKEFLTWDPELRFVLTLKMMDFLREGLPHKYILQVLDSPHWPSLRNIIDSIVFFITGPSPVVEVMISFAFFCMLPFGMLFILWKEKANPILSGTLFLLGNIAILQAEPILLYSFTGMMEVQGAFVFLFVAFYLSKYFQEKSYPEDKKIGWRVFLSTTLLYHTKYPYGYMLILSLVFLLLMLNPWDTFQTGMQYLRLRKEKWFLNPRFIMIALSIFSLILLPSSVLTGKLPSYLKYSVVVFASLDLFLYFWKQPYTRFNSRVFFILKWVVFPILLWMLSQPDRFGSYAGQINHVESQGFNPGQEVSKDLDYKLLFVTEFLLNGFQSFSLSYLIFFSNVFIFFYGYFRYLNGKKLSHSFVFASLCLLTFIELSLFTTNRLARHTYHLFPSMIVSLLLFLGELSKERFVLGILITLGITPLVAFPFLQDPIQNLKKTEICYTGYDQNDYKKPKWFQSEAENLVKTPTIVFNQVSPYHVNKADTEYLLYWLFYEKKIPVLFDPKRLKKLDPIYQELWIVGDDCDLTEKLAEKKDFWKKEGFDLEKGNRIQSSEGCIQIIPRN